MPCVVMVEDGLFFEAVIEEIEIVHTDLTAVFFVIFVELVCCSVKLIMHICNLSVNRLKISLSGGGGANGRDVCREKLFE